MNTKKKLTVIERIQKPLPSIKKTSQSSQNSPKNLIKSPNSPIPDSLRFKLQEPQAPEELLIRKIEESKKSNKFTSFSTPGISPQPKIYELTDNSKLSRDPSIEEIHIGKIEVPEYMLETYSSSNKKIEVEPKREHRVLNKCKDVEILVGRQKVTELEEYIENLTVENNELKIKVKGLEDSSVKFQKNWQNSENSVKNFQSLLKSADDTVKELKAEIGFKQGEIMELNELLKKSENKRRTANEQMSDLESKLVIFQRNVQKLTKALEECKEEVSSQKLEIQQKDQRLEFSSKQISLLEDALETERIKSEAESAESTRAKESLTSQVEDLKMQLEKITEENDRLLELNMQLQQDLKKPQIGGTSRKSIISQENNFLNDMTREEASRWHARYFAIEQELTSIKEQLESSSKNNSYFKSQITQKNEFIEKLESIIREMENNSGEIIRTRSEHNGFSNLGFFVQVLTESMKYAKDSFSCAGCFRFLKNAYVCVPCGHVVCDDCLKVFSEFCGSCAEKVVVVQFLKIVEKISDVFERYSKDLEKLLEIINGSG